MKTSYLSIITFILLSWTMTEATAQEKNRWTIGMKGGCSYTSIDRSNMGRVDETYSPLSGSCAGIQARYSFLDWLAIRADLEFMSRSYEMKRNLHYIDQVHTKYSNVYLMLPVMADFSFGGRKLRGHAYGGVYGAFWRKARTEGTTFWMTDYYVYFNDFKEERPFNSEDRRFIAGGVGGLGVSYTIPFVDNKRGGLVITLDALYYYDFVSHHKGYSHLSAPRYLSTFSVTLGLAYCF